MEAVGGFTFTDFDKADIIDICTPPANHFGDINSAIFFGKEVIVEKPLVGSLEMFDLLASFAPKRIIPVLQYRYTVEPFRSIERVWQRGPEYYDGWRGSVASSLGGVIASHAIHYLDIAQLHHGPVTAVTCIAGADDAYDSEVETMAAIHLETGSGPIDISVRVDPSADTNAETPPYEPFFEALRDGNPLTIADARPSLELVTACYISALSEERVTLPISAGDLYYGGWSRIVQIFQHILESDEQPEPQESVCH